MVTVDKQYYSNVLWKKKVARTWSSMTRQLFDANDVHQLLKRTQGPEEMCLSLEHQNPSKTSVKMGY